MDIVNFNGDLATGAMIWHYSNFGTVYSLIQVIDGFTWHMGRAVINDFGDLVCVHETII